MKNTCQSQDSLEDRAESLPCKVRGHTLPLSFPPLVSLPEQSSLRSIGGAEPDGLPCQKMGVRAQAR